MSKLLTAAIAAGAYVLGTKAGREQYEKICAQARSLWRDPRVQQKKSEAADLVKDKVKDSSEAADQVKDKVKDSSEAADLVKDKVKDSAGKAKTQGADAAKHAADAAASRGTTSGTSASANSSR